MKQRTAMKVTGSTAVLVGGGLVAIPAADASAYTATDFVSLANAIETANGNPGADTIMIDATSFSIVAPGLPTITDDLTIVGAGAVNTVISGDDLYRIFYVTSGAMVTISDLTLTHGGGSGSGGAGGGAAGGGAIMSYGSSLVLDGLVLSHNTSSARGGGLWFYEGAGAGSLEVSDCTFSYNSSTDREGGAAFVRMSGGNVTISTTTFDHNRTGLSAFGRGGSLFLNGEGHVDLRYSTFESNQAGVDGGAATLAGSGLYVTITGSGFADNRSDFVGGALAVGQLLSLTIAESSFTGNRAGVIGAGGALFVAYADNGVSIDHSLFAYNRTYGAGGAIDIEENVSSFTISSSNLLYNSASTGGAIDAYGPVTISNSTLAGNGVADDGGALMLRGSAPALIQQSTIFNNRSLGPRPKDVGPSRTVDGRGGGVFATGPLTITNSTVMRNTAPYGGGLFAIDALELQNTIVANNGSALLVIDSYGGYASDVDGDPAVEVGGNNNLVELSRLTLTGLHNLTGQSTLAGTFGYHGGSSKTFEPQEGSPVIDAGDDSVQPFATDQRDGERVRGEAIDIGALETDYEAVDPPIEPLVPELPDTGGSGHLSWWASIITVLGGAALHGASRRRKRV